MKTPKALPLITLSVSVYFTGMPANVTDVIERELADEYVTFAASADDATHVVIGDLVPFIGTLDIRKRYAFDAPRSIEMLPPGMPESVVMTKGSIINIRRFLMSQPMLDQSQLPNGIRPGSPYAATDEQIVAAFGQPVAPVEVAAAA